MKNCVYKFIDEKANVIYIGQAKDLNNRLNAHNHLPKECYEQISHIEYTTFDTEDDMNLAEKYYISKMKPKYNKVHRKKQITLDIQQLEDREWKVFKESPKKQMERLKRLNDKAKCDFTMEFCWDEMRDFLFLYELSAKSWRGEKETKTSKLVESTLSQTICKTYDEYCDLVGEVFEKQFPNLKFDETYIDLDGLYDLKTNKPKIYVETYINTGVAHGMSFCGELRITNVE